MSAATVASARDREMSKFNDECALVSKIAGDRKKLVASFEARALRPRPLSKLSLKELFREEVIVKHLLMAAVEANAKRRRELLQAAEDECVAEAITGESTSKAAAILSTQADQNHVVSQRLQDTLRLRLQLCRSEISRQKLSRRQSESKRR